MEGDHDHQERTSHWSFKIIFKCTSTETTEDQVLVLTTPPQTILAVKEQIEAVFNVPVCSQRLEYESLVMKDADEIGLFHIRSGDTLMVTYKAKAMCDELKIVVDWMQSLYSLMERQTLHTDADDQQAYNTIMFGYQAGIMEDLAYKKFSPWVSPVTQANKLYFLQIGGLEVLMDLYSLILQQTWSELAVEKKYVEYACMIVISNLASSLQYRKMIIQRGILPMCLKSLMRVNLKKGAQVEDDSGSQGPKELNDAILHDVIGSVVSILANICEIPEMHLLVAPSPDALHQLVCVSHSPSYDVLWSHLVATVFLCLAHSPQTHKDLTAPDIMEGLLDVPILRNSKQIEHMDSVLLEYFTLMYFAQLVLVSPVLMLPHVLQNIIGRMEEFVQSTTPLQLKEYEEQRRFSWSVFFPYVRLAYIPNTPHNGELTHCAGCTIPGALLSKAQHLALEIVLYWLRNTLAREMHQELFIREGLLDYIICIPWHVPASLKDSAKALVCSISTQVITAPPRLASLAKAKLAKMHFGLDKVIRVYSVHS